jgi:inosine-uridine nucleoside N-ribohydrolase
MQNLTASMVYEKNTLLYPMLLRSCHYLKKNCFNLKFVICSGIFLHDPVSFTALVHPEYFTFKKGVVRVETQGICTGHTLMDHGLKKYVVVLFLSNSHQLKYLLDISRLDITYRSYVLNLTKLFVSRSLAQ